MISRAVLLDAFNITPFIDLGHKAPRRQHSLFSNGRKHARAVISWRRVYRQVVAI